MKTTILMLLLSGFLSSARIAHASSSDSTRSVRGRVTNTNGKPLPGVLVGIASQSKGVPTDKDGFYLLSNVPHGATLVFMSMGYKMLMQPVPNEDRPLNQQVVDARLEPDPIELPPMGATAAYKALKLNPNMPAVATLPESATQTGTLLEEQAYFPTGTLGLMHYVAHHLHYPSGAKADKIEGDVEVEFTVSPSGAVDGVKIHKSLHPACDQEALRLVKKMPNWIPAKQLGKPIATTYRLPVRFTNE